jgi:hypothetical protein
MGGVFISYRREDTAGFAGRIYDRLASGLGREKIVFDFGALIRGADLVDVISDRVGKCDVLVVLISPHWITTADENGRRRIDDPHDFVRIEIEAALERGVRVIPVLVDGAAMPRPEDLPEGLKKLTRRQGIEISHDRFDADVERLVRVLSLLEEELGSRETAESEAIARAKGKSEEAAKPPNVVDRGRVQETARKAEHLFISYCNEDEAEARSLVDDLEKRGPKCWLASRDVQFNYQKEIVEAIRGALALIVVVSERANSSDEIPKEISLARKYKVKAIPVRIENTWPSGALEYELSNAQNIDLFKDRDREISRLILLLGPAAPQEPAEAKRAERAERERREAAEAEEKPEASWKAEQARRPAEPQALHRADQMTPLVDATIAKPSGETPLYARLGGKNKLAVILTMIGAIVFFAVILVSQDAARRWVTSTTLSPGTATTPAATPSPSTASAPASPAETPAQKIEKGDDTYGRVGNLGKSGSTVAQVQAIHGTVTGAGYDHSVLRAMIMKQAIEYNLAGSAMNYPNDVIVFTLQGEVEGLNDAIASIQQGTRKSPNVLVETKPSAVDPVLGTFTIPAWTSTTRNITNPYDLVFSLRRSDGKLSPTDAENVWHGILKSTLKGDDLKKLGPGD